MATKKEAIAHNRSTVSAVSAALLESRIVDPFKFLTNQDYSVRMINMFIESANVVRKQMDLPKLFLYDISEMD